MNNTADQGTENLYHFWWYSISQVFCTLLLPLPTVFWVFGNLIIGLLTHWHGSFIPPFNKSRYLTFLNICKQRHAPMGLTVFTATNIIACVAGIRGTNYKERNGSRLPSSFLRLLRSTAYQYHNVRPGKLTQIRPTQGAIKQGYPTSIVQNHLNMALLNVF